MKKFKRSVGIIVLCIALVIASVGVVPCVCASDNSNSESVYGVGIAVLPEKRNGGAEFDVVEKTMSEGDSAGKTYTCIDNITKGGWSSLSVEATSEAALTPNTECTVTLTIVCDGKYPAYYEESNGNAFIIGTPGKSITFKITTDENGEFEQKWNNIWINRTGMCVEFTDIEIIQHIDEHANKTHVEVMVADDADNVTQSDTRGFYFTTTNDPLMYNGDYSISYGQNNIISGGVYVDNTLSKVPLVKIAQGKYYVDLGNEGITVENGTKVVINGSYYDESSVVKMQSRPFVFNGNVWELTDSDSTVIIACSDFQHSQGNSGGAENVNSILQQIRIGGYLEADGFFCAGDYSGGFGNNASGVSALNNAVLNVYPSIANKNMIFLQGNHDDADTTGLSASGAHDTENYGVYVINEDDYQWTGNDEDIVKNTAQKLDSYLNSKITEEYNTPIFVISHLPLHYSSRTYSTGDSMNAKYIFDVLNKYGEERLNITFLYGHNHSSGYDDYLGGAAVYLTQGDNIYIAQPGKKQESPSAYELHFTYMNAGYVGYYSSENADTETTMTVFEITDDCVTVERYSATGLHNMKSIGYWNSDKQLIGAEDVYLNTEYKSPQIICTGNNDKVVWDSELNIQSIREGEAELPKKDGYVFAGWYREDGTGYKALSAKEADEATSAVAKYVDEKVLSVKFQLTAGITADSSETALRILTTVDSLNYSSVGLSLTIEGLGTVTPTTKTVYKTITGYKDGQGTTYQPSVFSTSSKYFMSYTITDIPNDYFGAAFTITPMWTTLDGTVVSGKTLENMKINDYIERKSVYGAGISITPVARNGEAVFTVEQKVVADGENAGKTYTAITNRTKSGWSELTIKATEEATLLANTEYKVTVTVACDGSPAYHTDDGSIYITKAPGGTFTFTITTDESGTFTKEWKQVYLNQGTYVDFTGIKLVANLGSVYGKGITVEPGYSVAVFDITHPKVTEGENAGKSYTRIENITISGFSKLTIQATQEAGLLPNTEYEVALDIACGGTSSTAYYEEHSGGNDFIVAAPGKTIKFTITTDENGAFTKSWSTIYVKTKTIYVEFTGIRFTKN